MPPPLRPASNPAMARAARSDTMAGPTRDRARRVAAEAKAFGAEGLVVCRIPGASHCATEGRRLGDAVRAVLGIPWVEMEIPPMGDAISATAGTRLEALIETARARRGRG